MNANILKTIYLKIGSNRLRYWGINALKKLGMRYLVVRLDTNYLCNIRCRMCYFNDPSTKKTPPMSPELFNTIAREVFPKTRVLYLSCGAEPFCTPNIDDYLAVSRQYTVPFTTLTSNCMLLNEQHSRACVHNQIDEIIVSVTGGTKETYEENHVGASWDTLWNNLHTLGRIKKESHSRKPVIKFNYILTARSIDETGLFIEKISSFRPEFITLREIVPFYNMDDTFYNENKLTANDTSRIHRVKQEFARAGIRVIDSIQCTEEAKPRVPEAAEKYFCIEPFFQLTIEANGDVRFCRFLDVMGNLGTQSFEDITHSEKAVRFFKELPYKSRNRCIHSCPNFISDEG